jgi:hypothetical protein
MSAPSKFKNFCTLFDQAYLSRGLVMMESLFRHLPEAKVHVVAFDDRTFQVLSQLGNPNLIPIPVSEMEDPELLRVKPGRSRGEYCWTCTPAVILYCIRKFNLPDCTYLDADLYFLSDPQPLLDEIGGNSVLITPHWYTPDYDQTARSGIYCVQFMTFRATEDGLKCLSWWRERCIEWCFARYENGLFGDQKYLDDWTDRFPGVHVLRNRGGGIAPWNVQQWEFSGGIRLAEGDRKIPVQPVFYHFHDLKRISRSRAFAGNYRIPGGAIEAFYRPYLRELVEKDASLLRQFGIPLFLATERGFFARLKKLVKHPRNFLRT